MRKARDGRGKEGEAKEKGLGRRTSGLKGKIGRRERGTK